MRKVFKYGLLQFEGARIGDGVRFVDGPTTKETGVILLPKAPHEINAVLVKLAKNLGYVELKQHRISPGAVGEAASASGIQVHLPVSAGGSLKIS